MLGKAWDILLEWLRGKPYWKKLQPFIILTFGIAAVEILAYQYIRAEYGLSPKISLFLSSNISIRIILVFGGIAAVLILFQFRKKDTNRVSTSKIKTYLIVHQKILLYRGVVVLGVLIALTTGFLHFSPRKVNDIIIKFMDPEQDFNLEALTYLIYELNRQQRDWFFELDSRIFNPDELKSGELKECTNNPSPIFCFAELYSNKYAKGKPLIGITSKALALGKAYFCEHLGKVSVISTFDRAAYEPISTYEYLMYCVIVQGILIHLETHGGGLPPDFLEESPISHGGVFQFTPKMDMIKSTILAARFSPEEEELLFNRFGAKYMSTCKNLLTLEWLHSERVSNNLKRHFDIVIDD